MKTQLAYLKSTGLSDRKIAERGGLGSPSFLKMIIDGKRSLTLKNILAVSQALGLAHREIEFFEALLHFEQAEGLDEKNRCYGKLLDFKKYRESKSLDQDYFTFFSHWYHVALFEAIASDYWKKPERFGKLPKILGISSAQFEESLALLRRLKFIEVKDGKLVQKEMSLETAPEVQSLVVRNFHRTMILKAQQAVEKLPQESRDVGALTIALSDDAYANLKRELFEFRSMINKKYSGDAGAKNVHQLCFQLFPLLKDEGDSVHDDD